MSDLGNLSMATVVDTSGMDAGMDKIQKKVEESMSAAIQRTNELSAELSNIPEVNINVRTDVSNVDTARMAQQELTSVIQENEQAIVELEAEYERISKTLKDVEGSTNTTITGATNAMTKQQAAIKKVIAARRDVVNQSRLQQEALRGVVAQMRIEDRVAIALSGGLREAKRVIKELQAEMLALESNGQRNTQRFRELQAGAATLTDAVGDTRRQTAILANDQAGFQGVISAVSGVTGAFAAAQGAMALFGVENEDLQKIMLKVQSLMAITTGLQQVSVMLNKDSAASIVLLNGVKSIWIKLTNALTSSQTAETVAVEENTAANATNTISQEANTTAEIENTTATEANTIAETTNASSTEAGAVANIANSQALVTETEATVAATTATAGLSLGMKLLRLAIMSTGIGVLIVAIGALISGISEWISKAKEATETQKALNEAAKTGLETYYKAKLELQTYTDKLKTFNGTKTQEKQLLEEVNNKYGEEFGYHKSRAEWLKVLTEKGEKYCEMLKFQAQAQAILNSVTAAYIKLEETKQKAQKGDFDDHWYEFWNWGGKSSQDKRNEAIANAQSVIDELMSEYDRIQGEARKIASEYDFGYHVDSSKKSSKSGKTFDPKKAAEAKLQAQLEYKNLVKKFSEQINNEISDANIKYMKEGLKKELKQSEANFKKLQEDWHQKFMEFALAKKKEQHDIYMSGKDATEEGWRNSADGKKTDEDWFNQMLEENKSLAEQYESHMKQLAQAAEDETLEINESFNENLIEQYGTTAQKIELLNKKFDLMFTGTDVDPKFPYFDEASRQLDAQIAKLESEKFKAQISWDIVFGDMSQQSLDVLEYNLDRVKKYFEANKDSMGIEEVKEYQDAIRKLQDAIAERNPFGALHQSLQDIGKYKTEFVTACQEYATASDELTAAQQAYNEALAAERELDEQTDDEGNVIRERQEGYAEAVNATALALQRMNTAEVNSQKAEQRVLNARNNITVSYKRFAQSLTSVNSLVQGLGGKAQNLAAIFSADVAKAIGKALDFTNEIMDAMSTVMSSIGDLGKSVATGVEEAVKATSQGATASAAAGAAAMSTLEKASAILAIIGAAMQVATAIANLFNNDDSKQEEIERLQQRIDQLQWELDNPQSVRLQENAGRAIDNLNRIYNEVYDNFARLAGITEQSSMWEKWFFRATYAADIHKQTVEELAKYYSQLSYSADKALGKNKWKDSDEMMRKYAEQIVYIKEQISQEESKKKSDKGKIQDYYNKIEEIGQKMQDYLNGILEDIIGYTAEDLASTLGEAFIEAASQGEDAMKAWGDKTKEIVGDIMKRMLIAKMIEEPIGQIFDKYKKRWFGDDGQFKGIDAVTSSMDEFANDINGVGEVFEDFWNTLPDSVKDWFGGDDEREGASRGIATASQESVDENNARLTTIQGHTYTLVQGMAELNRTSNAILDRVTGIERNTTEANEKLDEVKSSVKVIRDTVDNIHTQGIRLKT